MKEELFKKIYIKSVNDLPKKKGRYSFGYNKENSNYRITSELYDPKDDEETMNELVEDYDWYLQPIEPVEAEKKEKYPVIAIEDIDVETVKRWFQLFMGFKDDSKMKADIRAMARASHLNKHLNWEEVEKESTQN